MVRINLILEEPEEFIVTFDNVSPNIFSIGDIVHINVKDIREKT